MCVVRMQQRKEAIVSGKFNFRFNCVDLADFSEHRNESTVCLIVSSLKIHIPTLKFSAQ